MNLKCLQGLRILNTRPKEQSHDLTQAIQREGGYVIELPTLTIEPTPFNWVEKIPSLSSIQHTIFISANAVHFFFKGLESVNNSTFELRRNLNCPINIICIGKATFKALQKHGMNIVHVPTLADSEHLLQLPILQQIANQTILLIKGVDGRSLITKTLLSRNATVIEIDVYQRQLPFVDPKLSSALWRNNAVDIILITSEQSLFNLFTILGKEASLWLRQKPCLVISERLAKTAARAGMKRVIICQYDDILNTLKGYCYDNPSG